MKSVSNFTLLLCIGAGLVFLITESVFAQTSRGMKIKVPAAEGKTIELYYKDSYALVVGNGNYTYNWRPLLGALKDVDEVAQALEAHGFHVTRKKNLTKADFDRAFAEFIHRYGRDKDNRLLFYYAGHGHTLPSATGERHGYLVMVDTPLPNEDMIGFQLSSVDMGAFAEESKKIHSRHALFMFDSCFSDTIFTQRDSSIPQHISNRATLPVRQFIAAGQADEPVLDQSVFKQEFLNLIQGRAGEPFADGHITGRELGYHLETSVPNYNNGAQNPQYGKIHDPKLNKGDFVFVLPRDRETPVPWQDQTGSIFVTSKPPGAQVTLAGVLQARRTPMKIQNVMVGTHLLKLTLENYEDYMQHVLVEARVQVEVNATLKRLTPRPPVGRTPVGTRGRSKSPLIIAGVIAATGVGVAAYILTNSKDDGNDSGTGIDSPRQARTGELTIQMSIP